MNHQVRCTGADDARVSGLVVNRWTRYGHDRLYVQTPGGTRLGYSDCKSDLPVVAQEPPGRPYGMPMLPAFNHQATVDQAHKRHVRVTAHHGRHLGG